jgi:ABC-type glycerol-3-phosphate transport system permease component
MSSSTFLDSFRDIDKSVTEYVRSVDIREALAGMSLNGLLLFFALVFAFPFYYMVVSSTLLTEQIFVFPPRLLPGGHLIENYTKTILETEPSFVKVLFNSLIYAVFGTLGVILIGATGGYAFSKFAFPGRKPLFYLSLVTLAIPFQMIAIPLFDIMNAFGLINTFAGALLPALFHPIAIFFMKQNIDQTIIDDLLNSARVNGASEFQIWYKIVLPLIRPGLAALGTLIFLLKMNSLFWPLIILREGELQVGTVWMANQSGGLYTPSPWEILLPAAVILTLPALIVFTTMQRHFVRGLIAGSVKE